MLLLLLALTAAAAGHGSPRRLTEPTPLATLSPVPTAASPFVPDFAGELHSFPSLFVG